MGAALIFIVEPLVAKLLLPSYGGTATVWTTATFFFQVTLLFGYIFIHGTMKLGPRVQPFTQVPLLLLALLLLPLILPEDAAPEGDQPMLWLIRTLIFMIGLPFLVLSTTGPMLQKWYSWTDAPRAKDPYFLYAASNVGSFIGLFSYPFLVESHLTLANQRTVWSWAFLAFALLVLACGLCLINGGKTSKLQNAKVKEAAECLTIKQQLNWVFLAFVPSSLMLGATTYITTDVASIPLLWVVPLGLYLATMVWAFGRKSRKIPSNVIYFAVLLANFALLVTFAPVIINVKIVATIIFGSLTVIALAAHSILAADRPSTTYLTRYFVLVSLGGALGGAFNGLLSPVIFSRPFEYPLVLAIVPFLLWSIKASKTAIFLIIVVMLSSIALRDNQVSAQQIERSRTFYGSYVIRDQGNLIAFTHGTTLHGIQYKGKLANKPNAYYTESGPLGDVFSLKDYEAVTVIGLGAGTIATYGKPKMKIEFIEIDPEVVRLAKKYFTYLEDSKADVKVIADDGRLAVKKMNNKSQDLIILDAFNSDSIPVHLLTQEALKGYKKKLTSDGVIAIHISNRVFDLAPVVVGNAKALNMIPLYKSVASSEDDPLRVGTTWMTLVDNVKLEKELKSKGWKNLSYVEPVNWTDDYSSVLDVLY